jgi:tetratricopeptide (TPR) repeat protein
MGIAMRLARYFPTAVIGMASVAGQLMAPQPGCAWDSIPAAALSESTDMRGSTYISDSAVQPAAYYDSRPRYTSSSSMQPSNPSMQVVTDDESQSSNSQQQGPMYHGQKMQLPKPLFGRQLPTDKATTVTAQPSAQSSTYQHPQYVAPPGQSYNAVPGSLNRQQIQQRGSAGMPVQAQANLNYQTPRVPGRNVSQTAMPDNSARLPSLPTAALPVPMGPSTRIPNSSSVPPWQAKPAAASPKQSTSAAPSAGASAADRLVADAHEMSNRASSEYDYSQIIETCRLAQASQPSPAAEQYAKNLLAWSLNRRGQLKAEAGQDEEAILDFSEAVEADPSCWRAIHNRGVLTAQAGQFDKAYDDFARTIELNPKFAKAYSNRAALFVVANNLKAAREDYDHAIELDPKLAVAHRGDGRVCQLTGDVNAAITHYDLAVKLAPTDAYAAACRADLLTDLGRYSDAAAEYNRAIDLDPKSTQAQSGSAWLLATCPDKSIRKADLAIQRAQTVIELGGDSDAVSFDTLAAAQANAGDFDAAMNSARRAIQLAPADERDAYKARLVMYQQAKPYRISPVDRTAQQASYEITDGEQGQMR